MRQEPPQFRPYRFPRTDRPVQLVVLMLGAALVLLGFFGFFPWVTPGLDRITLAGPGSQALLFGVFQVSFVHNLVHLASGAAGMALSRSRPRALSFLLVGGLIYLLLWLAGVLTANGSAANFLPANGADDMLHLALGIGMPALFLLFSRRSVVVEEPSVVNAR